jgi:hypothetical protein
VTLGDTTYAVAANVANVAQPRAVALAAVTGGDRPDLLVAGDGGVFLLSAADDGSGDYLQLALIRRTGVATHVVFGDFDGSGTLDTLALFSNPIAMVLRHEDGAEEPVDLGPDIVAELAVADLDEDGVLDLVLVRGGRVALRRSVDD